MITVLTYDGYEGNMAVVDHICDTLYAEETNNVVDHVVDKSPYQRNVQRETSPTASSRLVK